MNDRNKELFFDDEEESVVITLADEDGSEIDTEVIAAIEIEELGKEYVAVLPQNTPEDQEELEAMLLEYSEDENGDPVFSPVEDGEEFEIVSAAFDQFFADMDDGEDEDEDGETGDYLDDIGDLVPGVSIQKADKWNA